MSIQRQISVSETTHSLIKDKKAQYPEDFNFSGFVDWAVHNHLEDYLEEKMVERQRKEDNQDE